ncbi:MAG: thioredoxin family protein [bacterium]|nr:thioredoxin family protein [bacterium]
MHARGWINILVSIAVVIAVVTVGYRLIYASNPFKQAGALFGSLFDRSSMLHSSLRREAVRAPDLVGIQQWFNTANNQPVQLSDLRGKVVIVDFWTYSCINCIRTMPYITAWDKKYRDHGLVIIGVHTPEFEFEKDPANVAGKIKDYGIEYPVAMDNRYDTWNAYGNQFWPAKYFIDHEGNIVWRHFGEGAYEESEAKIQELLRNAGLLGAVGPTAAVSPNVDVSQIKTPELYFGYRRLLSQTQRQHFAPQQLRPGEVNRYTAPPTLEENEFTLVGDWLMEDEYAELKSAQGVILIRYFAPKANLVLEGNPAARARVLLDGTLLGGAGRGSDVAADGTVAVGEPKLYNLTDTGDDPGWHTLEVRFDQPGVRAFSFTFG